jgi:hypothetical protein
VFIFWGQIANQSKILLSSLFWVETFQMNRVTNHANVDAIFIGDEVDGEMGSNLRNPNPQVKLPNVHLSSVLL